ncbi:ubiquitin-protein ligase molybdopterin-converting factor [Lasiosphaeris hirsuta]|uniref:Ubiquitin-protein ligase molybdopterin-converting factor n=1 Tax=Lasiosphaeris hirsuta TaxID=260670 RepID=A0AA40EC79_9PEZI|nr:ubiquitin-protein ligase molybdopterin-converting factor [Lasiosphaeris hirsuta]
MAFLISQTASNSRIQLAATAVVSAAAAATAILAFQRLQQDSRLSRLKQSIPDPADSKGALQKLSTHGLPKPDKEDEYNQILALRVQNGDFDDGLILEQLARNRVFLGPDGLDKLRNAFVVVVGCGGVGSHAAAALARSGVSKIRLIDFDQVTLSSLNRHAVATLADVGIPKVQCLQRRLIAITPWVRFDLRLQKFDGKSAASLLAPWEGGQGGAGQKPDFVIDAIDNIDSKVDLLKYCWDHNLPVISSMGAGTKSDPTRVMVGDIGTSTDDGLSRATRRRLKLLGVTSGIPVVYSNEKMGEGKAALLPLADNEFQKGSVGDLGVLPDFRVRILPVLGTMPAIFGYMAANHVILKITGYPIDYIPAKARDKMYDGILAFVQSSEERIVRTAEGGSPEAGMGLKVPLTTGDISFLVEELYRGRSIVTGIPTKLVLVRWKKPQESILIRFGEGDSEQRSSNLKLRDLVCMTKEEALRHQTQVLGGDKTPEELYDAEVIKKIAALQKIAEAYERHR